MPQARPSGVIADTLADIERTRGRMIETQRDFVTCISASRQIIDESWLLMAEADRLLDR